MKALRRIVGCTIRSSEFTEGGGGLVYWVLLVCEAAPMAAIDDENRKGKSCKKSVTAEEYEKILANRTVAENELGDASDVHG